MSKEEILRPNLIKFEVSEKENLRYISLIELADSLAKQPNVQWEKVEFLYLMCPQFPNDFKPKEKELDQIKEDEADPDYEYVSDDYLLTDEHQEALIALAKFLLLSEGKFGEKILPLLLRVLKNLPHCKWSKKQKITPDFFTYNFISTLRQISDSDKKKKEKSLEEKKSVKELIANALIDECLKKITTIITEKLTLLSDSKRFLRVFLGFFSSLSQGLPEMSIEQCKLLFNFVQSFITILEQQMKQKTLKTKVKSLMVISTNILIQFTYLKNIELKEYYPIFLKIANKNTPKDYTKAQEKDSLSKIFIASVALASRASRYDKKGGIQLLSDLLMEAMKVKESTPSVDLMVIAVIKGIQLFYEEELFNVTEGLKSLFEFIECGYPSKEVNQEAVNAICNILKSDYEKNGQYNSTNFVSDATGATYHLKLEDPLNNAIFGILVRISIHLNHQSVTSQIYHVLISQFSKLKSHIEMNNNMDPKKKSDFLLPMISYFEEISPLTSIEDFKTIIDSVFAVYKNPMDPQETSSSLGSVVSDFILRCATKNDKTRQNILLKKAIGLFIKLSEKIRALIDNDDFKNSKNKATEKELAVHVEILLPSIAYLMKSCETKIEDPQDEAQEIFRKLWFYIVLFNFEYSTLQTKEACEQIAQFGVLLKGKKPQSFLNTENQYDLLTKSIKIPTLNKLNNTLIDVLPTERSQILKLSVTKTAFLLSIYTLESQRIKNGSLKPIISYLDDQSLITQQNLDVYKYLNLIVEKVFDKWMTHIDSFDPNAQLQCLETEMTFLFKSLCSRIPSIREKSDKFIKSIIKKFPFIYYSFTCLTCLLDLQNSIYNGAAIGITTKLVKIQLPESNEELILPEYVSDRQKILENYSNLTLDWLSNALAYAPNVVRVALEEYLFHFRHSYEGTLANVGYSLALQICLEDVNKKDELMNKEMKLKGLSVLNENRQYLISQAVSVKSFHTGEISSLREFSKLTGKEMSNLFRNTLIETLNDFKKKKTLDLKKYNHYMQLATAFLITEKDLANLSLIQWIVWIPIYIFTEDSLKTATFCWKWLSTSRPDYDHALMNEIYLAWSWTIDKKFGLYYSSGFEKVELAINDDSVYDPKSDTTPHRLMIEFLSEMFQRLRLGAKELFIKILIRALKCYKQMNKQRASMGTRFRLCYLGSHVSIRLSQTSDEKSQSLIEKLKSYSYEAALDWFSLGPSWPDPDMPSRIVQEDIFVLQEFCKRLRLEAESLITHSKQISNITNPSPEVSTKNMQIERKMKGLKYVDLLGALVYNEMERIKLWFNPQKPNQYIHFPPPPKEIIISITSFPRNIWIKYLNEAWNFNPRLALALEKHFRFIEIKLELQELVKKNASSLIGIPEAIEYLITEKNINDNINEFQYLLNWEPCTLSLALKFLNKPFNSNILVTQYAIRALRRFDPETVVFYLPQLVQNLRHDGQSRLLKKFMLDTVKKSNMFAHQLIWTLRTELIDKKDLSEKEISELKPNDYEIAEIAELMIIDVLRAFSEDQKKVYEEEFGFFDTVTKISGELKEIPKENEQGRREGLVKKAEELKEMIIQRPNLYLPTSSEHKILGLYPEKSITLKSAKKVPILIPFRTKKVDHHGKEYPETDVKCIFKMGDDCRQDQLALQIIAMFKRIFHKAKLPLYLYPYRVITTGRGMGVIECVPDTKSRHEVGALSDGSLYDYFLALYGQTNSIQFQNARRNFIESMAAYSVVSYILNVKDRHNGNILMDEDGHVIHIDFGFLFDTQPGGKFGLEQFVSFKLTKEMLLIMGEEINKKSETHSDPFNLFKDLVIRAYLASRDYMDDIYPVVEVMIQSGLPCFQPNVMKNLKTRFSANKSDTEATNFIVERVSSSYDNIYSILYDKFQEYFEGVRG